MATGDAAGRAGTTNDETETGDGNRPRLFIVPGLMASELEAGGRPVWIDTRSLGQGDLERLDIEAGRVLATQPLTGIYHGIADHFAATHDVTVTHYDWRRSLREAALDFGHRLDQALEDTAAEVRILAHSAGGLVTLALRLEAPETWARWLERRGSRLVLAGVPLQGSMFIPQILLGRAPLVRALAHLDFQSDAREVARIFAGFPGLLELLPAGEPDLFSDSGWTSLPDDGSRDDWVYPDRHDLELARAFRTDLSKGLEVEGLVFLAGSAPATPAKMEAEDGIRFVDSNRGDGVVLWESAIPPGAEAWFAESAHGKLLSDSATFEALKELVETGSTERLPRDPPLAREDETLTPATAVELDRFPDWTYVACAAIGWPIPRAPKGRRPPVTAHVLHADLAAATFPVVVGHYASDGIAHAEAALDYHLQGRLSRLHQLDLYPSEPGACEIVLMPDGAPVAGGVVLGLGEVGSLSARGLAAATRRAVLKYSETLRTADRPLDGLSFLLIGTSDDSLTIEASIRSVLRGVLRANHELSDQDPDGAATLGFVEFVELYRDRAVQALDALRRVCGEAEFVQDGTPAVQAQPLRRHETGQRRVSFTSPAGWWDRLHIELDGEELRFTTPTSRARSEDSSVFIQADLIRQLLERARDRKGTEPDTPGALFELLMSNELKALIADRRDLVLVLDDGAAQFPWELLIDRFRGSGRPMSIGSGLIRSLRVDVAPPLEVARDNTVLVVGDPPSHWAPLPSAQREAREVARHFKGAGWEVTTQIEGVDDVSASSVVRTLMSERFRILHLAGHGDFQEGKPTRTGMVIGSRDVPRSKSPYGYELELLRPHEVLQMPAVPELVFINCCHLARQEEAGEYLRDRPRLASNLASQFIKNGVRAVVAAGWEVGDRSALIFAQQFYRKILSGSTFGDAVTEARQHVYSTRRTKDNTWGAFQCYGDPGFRLELRGVRELALQSRFLDTEQLLAALDNVVSRSKVRSREGDTLGPLRSHVRSIRRRLRADQRRNGAVLARLGRANAELGLQERAIELYEEARALDSGRVTLGDLEQLANLRARKAAAPFVGEERPAGFDPEQSMSEIRRSAEELEQLLQIAVTQERLSLLASTYKRLALVARRARQRADALERMTRTYARAVPFMPGDPYPLINALGGILLVGGPWTSPGEAPAGMRYADPQDFEAAANEAEALAVARRAKGGSFWDRVHTHDLALVRALHRGTLGAEVETIADGYRGLALSFGSERELGSVRDQLGFLIRMISASRARKLARLHEQLHDLEALRARLDGVA